LLAGVSGGAARHPAQGGGGWAEQRGATIVVILPDTGERYLSTPLFEAGADEHRQDGHAARPPAASPART
jgi:hypothetical protein